MAFCHNNEDCLGDRRFHLWGSLPQIGIISPLKASQKLDQRLTLNQSLLVSVGTRFLASIQVADRLC
jgi:hypothetical protein